MMDLTNYVETQELRQTRTILSCHVRLDKQSILEVLMHDKILIDGKYYKVPEQRLIECLSNKWYGEIYLNLEQITE